MCVGGGLWEKYIIFILYDLSTVITRQAIFDT